MKEKVLKFICTKSGKFGLTIALYGIVFAVMALLIGLDLLPVTLLFTLAFSIGGWKALNRIQPTMFLTMSWVGWFFYFAIKFCLSVLIGMFVTPYVVSKKIADVVQEYVKKYDEL